MIKSRDDTWIRCKNCGHKLMQVITKGDGTIETKCHSCKTINKIIINKEENAMNKNEFFEEMRTVATEMELGKVTVREIEKPNETYTGLVIDRPGVPSPVVNLDKLYRAFDTGRLSLDECKSKVKEILNSDGGFNFEFNIRDIIKWSVAKNQLYLRLTNDSANGIARPVEDMFLIPYIRVSEDDSAAVRVTPELLDVWEIDEDELFNCAFTNQEHLRPLNITDLGTVLGVPCPFDIYVVTTESGINGAGAIFYDGVFDDLYGRVGEFYIIPASVNEMLVVAKGEAPGIDELREMVTAINASMPNECDVLTNSIYTFDFENREFRKVG